MIHTHSGEDFWRKGDLIAYLIDEEGDRDVAVMQNSGPVSCKFTPRITVERTKTVVTA